MKQIWLVIILVLAWSSPTKAEVTNQADHGFTVKHETLIQASPGDVWNDLVAPARWWNGKHSWSGDAANFYLVPQAGGCFCELIRKTGTDNIKTSEGSVQHMRVVFARNNKMLRMSGALGPLQGEALTGTLTITLKSSYDGTTVNFTYKVGGYMEFPVDEIAPAVDGMIGEQLGRLAALFEEDDGSEAPANDADDQIEGDA